MYRVMNRDIRPGLGSGQPIAKAAIDMALHDPASAAELRSAWTLPIRPI